jgi:hypothetical protein
VKINKDNVVGAVAMLLVLAVIVWGWMVTVNINKLAKAHDALVNVLAPVINQVQQANALQQQARQQAALQQETPKPATK